MGDKGELDWKLNLEIDMESQRVSGSDTGSEQWVGEYKDIQGFVGIQEKGGNVDMGESQIVLRLGVVGEEYSQCMRCVLIGGMQAGYMD